MIEIFGVIADKKPMFCCEEQKKGAVICQQRTLKR
jgi:hypothetical protein